MRSPPGPARSAPARSSSARPACWKAAAPRPIGAPATLSTSSMPPTQPSGRPREDSKYPAHTLSRDIGDLCELIDDRVLDRMSVLYEGTPRTCSVCSVSLTLGAAGLLEGRRASTHWGARNNLHLFNATYSAERVTEDGKYLTSA